jgi:hypothetical protein
MWFYRTCILAQGANHMIDEPDDEEEEREHQLIAE